MKIRCEVPWKMDIYNAIFNKDPNVIIQKLQKIIKDCDRVGFSNIEVKWDWPFSPYPTIYGDREETKKEEKSRSRAIEIDNKIKEKEKQIEISKAKEILKKYNETI